MLFYHGTVFETLFNAVVLNATPLHLTGISLPFFFLFTSEPQLVLMFGYVPHRAER